MAVYTQVSAEELIPFLARYDAAPLVAFKGIAEGVENSNFLVETETARYFLTLYERRVDPGDLPYFFALLDHCADRGLAVPRAIRDREDRQLQELAGRPACLIEFLPGISVTAPTAVQAQSAGRALGALHAALADFPLQRPNALGRDSWESLARQCGASLDAIEAGLAGRVAQELAFQAAHWPAHLPRATIHADLFPDNVLILGDDVAGLIDFYFSCTDIRALDLAITHAAWCFSPDGTAFDRSVSDALTGGYAAAFGLTEEERAALPVLVRGACLRFLLTRAFDWINTPAGALVTRKDPLAFRRRLDFYSDPSHAAIWQQAT